MDRCGSVKYLVAEYEKLSGGCDDLELLQFYALLKNICEEFDLGLAMPSPEDDDVMKRIKDYCAHYMRQAKIKTALGDVDRKYKARLSGACISDEKKVSIQGLMDKLREMINVSTLFDDEHRQRVLEQLEKLQFELHKKITNFDKVISGMVRFAKALGLSAKEAKPFTDTVGEMYRIVHESDPELRHLPAGTGGDVLSLPQGEPE